MNRGCKYFIAGFLFLFFSNLIAQNHCIEFSKEKRKTVSIEVNKKISFVLNDDKGWSKGVITNITSDSVFIEQGISKEDILKERESNYEIIGYKLQDFKMLAYPKTSSAVRGTTIVLLLATVVFAAAVAGGGGLGMIGSDTDDESAQKKFFKKNIDFEGGWSAQIIRCSQK